MNRHFHFNNTSLYFLTFFKWSILQVYFRVWKEKHYLENLLQIYFCVWTSMHKPRKSTSSILMSFKINISVLKASLKYTSEFENGYINLESLLEVCFWVLKTNAWV